MPAARKIRLISLDVDGTLLDSKGSLPAENEEAVKTATSLGVKVILNTGKPLGSIEWLVQAMNLSDPVVALSGAIIFGKNGAGEWDTLQTYPISKEGLNSLAEPLSNTPLSIFVCTDLCTYAFHSKTDPVYQLHVKHHMSRTNIPNIQTLDRSPFKQLQDFERPILKIFLHGDIHEEVQEQLDEILACDIDEIIAAPASPGTIDIYSTTAGKLQAIRILCKVYKIDRSEVLALGDYDTDLELIQWAGVGVLMENAPDTLKAKIDRIAPSNDDQGVAQMIRTYVL